MRNFRPRIRPISYPPKRQMIDYLTPRGFSPFDLVIMPINRLYQLALREGLLERKSKFKPSRGPLMPFGGIAHHKQF